MAIKIRGFDGSGNMIGDVIPEYIPSSLKEELNVERQINSITDGYSPDKQFRKIGSIDPGVLYNYAMSKGIPNTRHSEFWAEDNGKNLLRVLNEFPVFKTVDKPI